MSRKHSRELTRNESEGTRREGPWLDWSVTLNSTSRPRPEGQEREERRRGAWFRQQHSGEGGGSPVSRDSDVVFIFVVLALSPRRGTRRGRGTRQRKREKKSEKEKKGENVAFSSKVVGQATTRFACSHAPHFLPSPEKKKLPRASKPIRFRKPVAASLCSSSASHRCVLIFLRRRAPKSEPKRSSEGAERKRVFMNSLSLSSTREERRCCVDGRSLPHDDL